MEPMAYIGAGMCALSMMAAAWGVSQVWTTIIATVGRNPQVKKEVDIYGWAGFAAVEAIALYASIRYFNFHVAALLAVCQFFLDVIYYVQIHHS